MGQGTRKQSYPYTFKSVVVANEGICADRVMLYVVPPEDGLTIEALFCHFVMQFDSGVSAGDRILSSLGISNEASSNPDDIKRVTINQQADGNRRVDYSIDLTPYLTKENVGYTEYTGDFPTGTNYTIVEAKFPAALALAPTTGTIDLWKIDALFTTTGIR